MRLITFVFCFCAAMSLSCSDAQEKSHIQVMNNEIDGQRSPQPTPSPIAEQVAIDTAKNDFVTEFGSLDEFEVITSEQKDSWRVTIQLKDKTSNGGGAVYTINKATGRISERRFYQ